MSLYCVNHHHRSVTFFVWNLSSWYRNCQHATMRNGRQPLLERIITVSVWRGLAFQGSWKLGSTSDSRFPVEFSKRRERRQQQFSQPSESPPSWLFLTSQPWTCCRSVAPAAAAAGCCCDPITNKGTYLILRKAIGSLG